ncbi:hypothetical protein [Nocardioides sp.]|uniref:hypothetical protein n=1 Tax=Nocardioides sp. TaxID=35761 RepID=UPI00286BD4FF|nr:hypothetical protein [Nocardioides sp.]
MTRLRTDLTLTDLPPVVAAYVATDAGADLDAFVAPFAESAAHGNDLPGRCRTGRW